ncbi:TIGR00269 family protein [Methanobrevibacter sp.]
MVKIDKEEFNQKIFTRINNLINEYKLIKNNDKIAVALSGGKDSVLTLHALSKYQEQSDIDFELIAISVDEGIKGYRSSGLDAAVNNCKLLDIELVETSFFNTFNYNLDDIYQEFKSACIVCGVFRRYILNKTSHELNCDKIATGHNLDDEIQSFLMSFARADTIKFSKFGPELSRIHPKLVPRIKPLWNTPEKEVGMWVLMNNIDVHLEECPYSYLSLRSKIKGFLNDVEDKIPQTKLNILNSFVKSLNVETKPPVLYECKYCKEPSSTDVCKACEILKLLEDIDK